MISELLARFGYIAVAVGAFLEGELVLLAAGALVQAGQLALVPAVLAGGLGSAAWGQTWFHVGRASGAALLARRPAWQQRAKTVERWLSSSGVWVLLGGRFAPGMGTVLPSMIGASGLSRSRFSAVDAVGALLWSTCFSCAGVGVGAAWSRVAAQATPGTFLLGTIAAGVSGVLAWRVRRRPGTKAPELATDAPRPARKRVIITGDDFGLVHAVNEAIELGYRHGVLTTTSLMVGERAAADAVARAHRNPGLRVGLHLTLCEGLPTLPAREVRLLTKRNGELRSPAAALLSFLLLAPSRRFRAQLEAEIRGQFAAFRASGLTPDHVNAHNNLQLHPVVLPILLRVAREHGVRAVRVPYEPLVASWRAARRRPLARLGTWLVMGAWSTLVKRRLRREGFIVNDYLFGVVDCGCVDAKILRGIIENLPDGTNEIHVHPAAYRCAELSRNAPGYEHEAELVALTDPQVREALIRAGVESLAGFAALTGAAVGSLPAT